VFRTFVTGFRKLLEPKRHFTLKMDSDIRDRYQRITNIEALLDTTTTLNNPPNTIIHFYHLGTAFKNVVAAKI